MTKSVVLRNITKKYKMYSKTSEKLLDLISPKGYGEDFYALQGISFEAEQGDVIGIIGVNGSGKSTLSNILSGIIPPTSGEMEINGQASLIAIASGLNNELTGRENIELKCLMLGFSKKEIRDLEPEIIEFADIGKFIDQPVKSYSSGMKSRLGFAISVHIDPDILIIDEALSVGDQTFTDKCLAKMNEFKEKGKTIFFISHSIGQMKKFCEKALWIQYGRVKDYGMMEDVMPKYEQFLKDYKKMSKAEQKALQEKAREHNEQELAQGDLRRSRPKKKGHLLRNILLTVLLFIVILAGIWFMYPNVINRFVDSKTSNYSAINKVDNQSKTIAKEKEIESPKKYDIAIVKKENVNIRTNNDINSRVIDVSNIGMSYNIIEKKVDINDPGLNWVKIKLIDNEYGWISQSMIQTIDDYQVINKPKTELSLLSEIMSKRRIPTDYKELNKWFETEDFSNIKKQYSDLLINATSEGNREQFDSSLVNMNGFKNRLSYITLKNVDANDTNEIESELGKVQYTSSTGLNSVYLINGFNVQTIKDINKNIVNIIISKAFY
ncbi:teichoic acids export ABC transporter ATP-binding subunit TagH [Terrilactibacillus laevilacticus]|uniref:Teichoic acids export ABC transporter ATP-binding subunit TagH n=1 Tax=Terrilactibacillus laevilacticus TaxID=1380157 RepID=A0ABW5PQ83_9BACI|nr:teichoic acids export ABC transporter ATP-binding subunit TagH [Terrilactibacillus laevilacticus]